MEGEFVGMGAIELAKWLEGEIDTDSHNAYWNDRYAAAAAALRSLIAERDAIKSEWNTWVLLNRDWIRDRSVLMAERDACNKRLSDTISDRDIAEARCSRLHHEVHELSARLGAADEVSLRRAHERDEALAALRMVTVALEEAGGYPRTTKEARDLLRRFDAR